MLGAGPAGIAAAHSLSLRGKSVTVIDREPRAGGTHRSFNIGQYTFDSGSVFFEQNHPLFEMFDGLRELCPSIRRKQGRIAPDASVQHYPFKPQEALRWRFDKQVLAAFELATRSTNQELPPDVEALCVSRLGRTIYETTGLSYYIRRFNREDPAEIDAIFFDRRMNFVLKRSRISALVKGQLQNTLGMSTQPTAKPPLLVRPLEGFEALYGRAREKLEAKGVVFKFNSDVEGIVRGDGMYQIHTSDGIVEAEDVVGAMPLDHLHRSAFGEGTGLEGIDLITLFVSVSDVPGFDGNVLFNFHEKGRWKRATIYSRIYGRQADRDYFAVEITNRPENAPDAEAEFARFREDVRDLGLFAPDLRLEGFDIVRDAYPLYRKGCQHLIDQGIARLKDLGIHPVGRQGRFDYLPISATVISKTRAQLSETGLLKAETDVSET
ncbi:MAG: NAD(P)-binding protein [Pseudomonadota bacterium]